MKKSIPFILEGEIRTRMVEALAIQLVRCKVSKSPLVIGLCTEGGSAVAGFALYNLIRHYQQFFPIDVVATGKCMSAGVIVLQAGRRRLAVTDTQFMVHGIQSLFDMSGRHWTAERAETSRLGAELWRVLSERTHIKHSQVTGRKEHHFSAAGAVKAGLIDRVLNPRQARALAA